MKHPQLTPEENLILEEWALGQKPKLSVQSSLRLYELFLNGSSMQEIFSLNPMFTPGQILNARISEEWDRRKQQHLDHLFGNVVQRFAHVQSESAMFIANVMAVQHKLYGEKLKRYLLTEDEDHLKGIPTAYLSGAGYRAMIDGIMKITGQDKHKDPVDPNIHRNPSAVEDRGTAIPMKALPAGAAPKLDTSEASQILRKLDEMGVGKD